MDPLVVHPPAHPALQDVDPIAAVAHPALGWMFGPGIWWSGIDLKRLGSADDALQMAS